MLHCGREWHPRQVDRVIEAFDTSTRVVRVSTDCGIGFLKGMGNPAGDDSLISELVCGELCRWFGLRIPNFAVIPFTETDIQSKKGVCRIKGPAFISQEVFGIVSDGSTEQLDLIQNKSDVSKLIVFDTWVRNGDRFHPDESLGIENRDNILFTVDRSNLMLTAFDHTHCFSESTLDDVSDPDLIEDPRIYGLFPEFLPFVDSDAMRSAADRLRELDGSVVDEILRSVPREWGMTSVKMESLKGCILRRAELVARGVNARWVDGPSLPFRG